MMRRKHDVTFERKILVGLEDIKAISFQCEKCQYRITMSPDDIRGLPEYCLGGHPWAVGIEEESLAPPLRKFTKSLERLRVLLNQKALGFRILFELDELKINQ